MISLYFMRVINKVIQGERWSKKAERGWFCNDKRKKIIRSHLLLEKGSDYIGLVRLTGLEPARCYPHGPQPCASAIPPQPHIIAVLIFNRENYYTLKNTICKHLKWKNIKLIPLLLLPLRLFAIPKYPYLDADQRK